MAAKRGRLSSASVETRLRVQLAIKRMMDVAVAALLLLILAVPLAVVAILIKTTSPGPLLYPCDWVGQNERRFRGYKLRTMVAGAAAMEESLQSQNQMVGPAFKIDNDPRITPLGHFLRKYSIDELPQLWSVLKGDLSLVGPRPPREHEYARFTEFQKGKLAVKPGMTCLWQVEGRHRINDYDDWVARDLEYIRRWSIWLDIDNLYDHVRTNLGVTGGKVIGAGGGGFLMLFTPHQGDALEAYMASQNMPRLHYSIDRTGACLMASAGA